MYVVDAFNTDGGNINGGWTLNVTTSTPVCATSCAGARLVATSILSCVGGTVQADIKVQNQGIVTASGVMLTQAQLGSPAVGGMPVPQGPVTIAPGSYAELYGHIYHKLSVHWHKIAAH